MPPLLLLTCTALAAPRLAVEATLPAFRIGEPVWVELVVTNPESKTIDTTVYPRFQPMGFAVTATGPDGAAALDPYHRVENPFSWGVKASSVAPGATGRLRLDLSEYVWFDTPGTWTVEVFHPLGGSRAPRDRDPRVATVTIEVIAPTDEEARQIVESLPRTTLEQPLRPGPRIGWWSLGHERYVDLLEPLAAEVRPPPEDGWGEPTLDDRALAGLAACPCVAATRALIRLEERATDPELLRIVRSELLARLHPPYHRLARVDAFASRAWDDPTLARFVARARQTLDTSSDPAAVGFAARVIERAGGINDGALLAAARRRVRAADDALAAALRRFPEIPPDAGPDDPARLVAALSAWHPWAPSPPEWDDLLLRAMRSGDRQAASLALLLCPADPAPELADAEVAALAAEDTAVRSAAASCLARHGLPSQAPALIAALDTASEHDLIYPLLRAARRLAPVEGAERVVALLGTPGEDRLRIGALLSNYVDDHESCWSWPASEAPPDVPRIRRAWTRFLVDHGDELEAGARFTVATVDPAMLPRSCATPW